MTEPIDESPPLEKAEKTNIQRILGTLLYYSRAVDPTLAVALSSLAAEQSKGTQKTAKAITEKHGVIKIPMKDANMYNYLGRVFIQAMVDLAI